MQEFQYGQAVEFCRNGEWIQGDYLGSDCTDNSYSVYVKGEGVRWIFHENIRAVESNAKKTSKTFTFKMFPMKGLTDPETFLNEKGAEGWRLATIDYGCFIMEKEVQ